MNRNGSVASDALKLEEINFCQWISEASVQANIDIKASERSMAARGFAQSGPQLKAVVDIIFASIESVTEKAINRRRELGRRVPELLEPDYIAILKNKLNHHIDGGVNAVRHRSTHGALGEAVGTAFTQEAERRASSAKARLAQKLVALPLEVRLGVHPEGGPAVTTFNISNSTIANLNLGNVVGDLNSSIQILNSEGKGELAKEVRNLTEAIASSKDLSDDSRKELLEHLAVVSAEAAATPEKRKTGPLKTSMEAIRSGVGIAVQLVTLWQGVEHALKTAGIIRG